MIITLGRRWDMNRNLDNLHWVYESLGVQVIRIPSETRDAVFHRDVFVELPSGLIQCRMSHPGRSIEPRRWFRKMNVTPQVVMEEEETFEGSDLAWIHKHKVLVGIGNKTDFKAVTKLSYLLSDCCKRDITVIPLPIWHDQHLLGLVNCIGDTLFSIKTANFKGPPGSVSLPRQEYGIKGPNWVQIGERVIINKDCKRTIKVIEDYAEIIPVPIDELLSIGRGVACATGILRWYKYTS